MAFELDNFYMCIYICVASWIWCMAFWYKKLMLIIFHIRCSSLNMLFFVVIITCCIKCFQFCVFKCFLLYELMFFFFFVILHALNLTVFLKYYCIEKSKLNLEMSLAMFHNDYKYRTLMYCSMNIWKVSGFL